MANTGDMTATGVGGTISTSSLYVSWYFNTISDYPDIVASCTGTNFDDYDFELSSSTPIGTRVSFDLYMTASNGGPRSDSSNIVVGQAASVPEPATMLLLGSGLIGLVAFRKKFRKS